MSTELDIGTEPFYMAVGNTAPTIVGTLQREGEEYAPDAADVLSTRFEMRKWTTTVFDERATYEGDGTVSYSWRDGDLDEHGIFFGRFTLRIRGEGVLSFPNKGGVLIRIE